MTEHSNNPLTWRGLMADVNKQTRITAFVVFMVALGSLVFCQLGFVPLGGTRLLLVLAPITAGALLYGTRGGTALGAIGGASMMLHALLIPFDYYEKYFASPVNSIVLFTLTGLLLGVLFYFVQRIGTRGRAAGLAALIVACFIGSWFASTFFQISAYVINALMSFTIPKELLDVISGLRSIAVQLVLDGLIMSVVAVITGSIDFNRNRHKEEVSLRDTFLGWLAVVVAVAFMASAAFCYSLITVGLLDRANSAMDGHIAYLQQQLAERDEWVRQVEQNSNVTSEQRNAMLHSSITNMADKLKLWNNGITIVAENDEIASSSEDSFVGRSFQEVIGGGLQGGFTEDVFKASRPLEFYMGSASINYLKAGQISYIRAQEMGKYQVAAILSAEEVFEYRMLAMVGMTLVFLMLFGVVFVLASRLLQHVVVRNIDQTNEVLDRITHGDLDQQVNITDSREFTSLSHGINSTVGALKDSIAETAARIDRELATSKAIQESALPRTFPPFPEVQRFDIFARMEPAREVGGDFYDFFLLEGDRLGMIMADVSGKGIPAALFMMAAKTELEACLSANMELVEAVSTANYHLCHTNDAGMFVTVFAAVFDYHSGVLQYVNAGHNPPLVRRNGTWEWLNDKSGLLMGAYETAKYKVFETTLAEGDEILLYTDGVTEAWNPQEELYSEERLESLLQQHTNLHPHKLIDAIRRDLLRYADGAEQADDITMLALEYGVPPEVSASITLPARLDQLDQATDFIHTELARRTCPISVQNKIDICLEELFVNVANYAYPNATSDTPGRVTISYVYNPEPQGITIEIIDDGEPFDPLAKPDPDAPTSIEETSIGGLGIFMTKTIADDISYVYRNHCNVTSFTKNW